jgi:KaiC/GvpD/RAD55 family RecA-like ATPase
MDLVAGGYGLDSDFEALVVLLTCSNSRFYGKIGHAVKANFLSTDAAAWAVKAAHAIAKTHGRGPDSTVLVIQRLRRWSHEGKIKEDVAFAVNDLFERAEELGELSSESISEELAPILRKQEEQKALLQAIDTYKKGGDLTKLTDAVTHAARLGKVDTSLGTKIGMDSFDDITNLRHLDRLPTGVDDLDLMIDDGLGRGSLGVLIGGSGDGKSMALSQIAAYGLTEGLHVAYATLELPEAHVLSRIKAALTGIEISTIMRGAPHDKEARRRLKAMAPDLGCGIVKEFTPHATTVEDIKDWVKTCEDAEKREVDLLVVDYGDKLYARKQDSQYNAMRVVYEGLRILATEKKFWCWTASQSGRRGNQSKDKKAVRLDLNDVADSMHKVRVADLVITLTVTETETGGRDIEFFVAKNRTGRARFSVGPMPTEFEIGRIAPSTAFMSTGVDIYSGL